MPILTEAVKGRVKGREAPPERLEEFTFQGTGRTVQIRKLSALIRDEVRRQVKKAPGFEEPHPPIFLVDYGDDNKIKQANRAHPIYQELLSEWTARINQEAGDRLADLVIKRGVVCEIDHAAVQDIRAAMAAADTPLDDYDDHYVYVAFVCIGPQADYTELLAAVFNRTIPSREAVQAHIDSFPGAVRGQIDLAPEPGPADGSPGDPDERGV
jgi:hypothetical protein